MEDFLFDKERLKARVQALSGGEKGRLLLARLLLEPANLLILDEPTNDLDIGTLAVLEQALTQYKGTILVVSHDRAFMDRVATRILACEGDGTIIPIEGGYSDYQAWKARQTSPEAQPKASNNHVAAKPRPKSTSKKLSYKEQTLLTRLPQDIEALENEQSDIEQRFCNPSYFQEHADAYQKDQQRLQEIESLLLQYYDDWEALEEKQASLLEE